MMMTSAQVINTCFTVVEISFYRVYSHPEPLLPIHVPQTCYNYFPLCFNWRTNSNFCSNNNSIRLCDRKSLFVSMTLWVTSCYQATGQMNNRVRLKIV